VITSPTLLTPELRGVEEAAQAELDAMSNWGRWGEEDERGAVNVVDLDSIQRGTAAIKQGRTYPLGQVIRENGVPMLNGRPPCLHYMSLDGGDWAAGAGKGRSTQIAEDTIIIPVHAVTTHVDAFSHAWKDHEMYNGFSGNFVRSYGATRLGIENLEGIVTRGVLLDMAGFRGVDVMEATDYITLDDVLGCCEREGVTIERGDAVLFRTGWPAMFFDDPDVYSGLQPGVGSSAALYLAKRDICLIGADNTAVQPHSGYNPVTRSHLEDARHGLGSLHTPYLRNLGIYMLEMLDLSKLAADGIYEFLFCLAPLLIKGGTGSPVNPLAIA
jgi:kynurenine formamidase